MIIISAVIVIYVVIVIHAVVVVVAICRSEGCASAEPHVFLAERRMT